MTSKLEPAIWPRDTGQRILCFDRCQLIVAWMSNIKEVNGKPWLYVSGNLLFGLRPPCCVVVVVVRTRPRAIPLAKITMRKSTHGFPALFYTCLSMELRLAALRAAGAPLLMHA